MKRILGAAIIIALIISNWAGESFALRSKAERRDQAVEVYLKEFVGEPVHQAYPKIYQAIEEVFHKLPADVFKNLTDRRRPVVIIVNITSGIAKYANSTEFTVGNNERQMFAQGFYLLKLGDELENSPNIEAIEGIVFHELAHRYLEHLRQPVFSCEMEREANRQVKKWGFEKEYKAAKEFFGAKNKEDSPCFDAETKKQGGENEK